jgi:hypothetical protein
VKVIFHKKFILVENWGCGCCLVTLEPPLPARQTQSRWCARRAGRNGGGTGNGLLTDWPASAAEIFGDKARRGAPVKVGASSLYLSPRFLKLIYLKRYVGGLVQFDGSDVCISTLVGFRPDDRVSASLFDGSWLTLLTESTSNMKRRHVVSVRLYGGCAEVRTSRTG